ncbi:MAG: MFS transporter [Anaerolineae bacterium]|nr:MFS transporter [Anaerolineae bacterium]MDW8068403.1 MFS transporter [Anaerolineae bacterium]
METTQPTPPKRRWLSVVALAAAAFVDSSENQSLAVLWSRMYPALSLRAGQLGPVLGISDLVRTLTLPFWGWVADHFSRKALLVGITGLWGGWTLAIAFVHTFGQLLIVRVLSSLGLGVLWPTAFSLLSDLFDTRRRGIAAGVMAAISYCGSMAAFIVLPILATIEPYTWRLGFLVMGAASVLTGLFLLVIYDPPRGAAEPELRDVITEEKAARYAFRLRDLPAIARVRTWWVLLFQNSVDNVAMAVLYGWAFVWLDSLGLGPQASIVVVLLTLGMLSGQLFFGWLGDRLERRYPVYGRATMALIGLFLTAPSLLGLLASGRRGLGALMLFGLLSGLGISSVDTGARWPMAQGVLRPELRSTARAALDMVIGAVGALMMTFSGSLVDAYGVTTMLLLLVPIPKMVAAFLWLPVFRTYPVDRAALHQVLMVRRQEMIALDEPAEGA